MGKLINGQWFSDEKALAAAETKAYQKAGGHFERGVAGFRHWITKDGSPGSSGRSGFKAETNRYHLFAALNCPWAHRTLIYRKVKGLENIISLSLAAPKRTNQGWVFEKEGRFSDPSYGLKAMHELYIKADSKYNGRVTVPVLWDKKEKTIVSNESAEIIRMFNSAFDELTGNSNNYLPEHLKEEINTLNDFIFNKINNGTYKTGFARTQAAYTESVTELFKALDQIEKRLSQQKYLLGDKITEADWRLLPTLARFDVGYFTAFKCNLKALRDYPYISSYFQDLYQQEGISETIDFEIYKKGYHSQSDLRNPHGIIPTGCDLNLIIHERKTDENTIQETI